ncbi:MAG TPA: phosphoribosyltransferase family protein [Polyangiaceae bacterium]|nr:phosphoribosyltransferase family protein [Polyangiaceae bacterium]
MELLARAISRLLDTLSPPSCAACDAPSAASFCPSCGTPEPLPAPQTIHGLPLLVASHYAPPLSTAITRFKYADRPELARRLAPLLLPGLRQLRLPADATLVPVPLHAGRLATRGYNQAALLAQELARQCPWRCEPRFLLRTRATERQVGKAREERLTNALGAFVRSRSGPAQVVLVDDVVTTGSTVRACAQALADGGAKLVAVVALARALAD